MFHFEYTPTPAAHHCRICEDVITLVQYQRFELCADCEFDELTPPTWMDMLMAAMEKWKKHKAT